MSEQKMTELKVNGSPIRYDLVPVDYMADGLKRYFEHGIAPGSFMSAVLRNDFMSACHNADQNNQDALWRWGYWLYNYAPSGSFGSHENFCAWMDKRAALRKATGEPTGEG